MARRGSGTRNGNGGNLGGIAASSFLKAGTFASVGVPTEITGSEVNRWFLAFDQGFESAALHLYMAYQHFETDLSLVTRDLSVSPDAEIEGRSGVDRRLRRVLYRRPHLLLIAKSPFPGRPRPPFGAVFFCSKRPRLSRRVPTRAVAGAPQKPLG